MASLSDNLQPPPEDRLATIPFNLDTRRPHSQNIQAATHAESISNFYSYQDPRSGFMPETKIENDREEKELCFKKSLLILIISLSSFALLKSCGINAVKLSKNIALNIKLRSVKKKLEEDRAEIQSKISANNSFRGMKKVIKEEIKALDANEILIRFES